MDYVLLVLVVFTSGFFGCQSQSCEDSYSQRCLTQLHKFTNKDNHLIFANSKHELQVECVQAQSALSCLTRYARKCLSPEERDVFLEAINGPQQIIMGLCAGEKDLKRKYLEILPCLKNSSKGLQYCKEKYDRNQRDIVVIDYQDKVHLECCSFDGYRRCLKMLMDLQSDCANNIAEVAEEIVMSLGGTFTSETCLEHYERCTGSGSLRSSSPHILSVAISFLIALFVINKPSCIFPSF